MRKFLTQFMSASEVDKIEEAFKAKNPESSGLPTYISKTRLDEEITKRKAAEEATKNFEAEKAKAVKEATDPLKEQLKGIPEDWKKQLDDAKAETASVKTEYEGKLAAATKSAEVSAKIYESGARNIKAVQALLDDTKPVDDQLKALKESDPYLFRGKGSLTKGTGKGDGEHGGDGDGDSGKPADKISEEAMYRAVGIAFPNK